MTNELHSMRERKADVATGQLARLVHHDKRLLQVDLPGKCAVAWQQHLNYSGDVALVIRFL